jgi:hypothetical protein
MAIIVLTPILLSIFLVAVALEINKFTKIPDRKGKAKVIGKWIVVVLIFVFLMFLMSLDIDYFYRMATMQ